MDKRLKKQIKKYVGWTLAVLAVVWLAVMPLLAEEKAAEEGPQATLLTAAAQNRDIETQLIGGGLLTSSATEAVTIPEKVKLTEYLVGNGDSVEKGDPIARVDKVSVLSALAEVQETLDYLSKQIAGASTNSDADTVKAHAGGLVKAVYGQPGDSVREVMLAHGALAVLSLDGRMALDIEFDDELKTGSSLLVVLPDGSEAKGRVEAAVGGTLTVSLKDEGYAVGDTVTVKTEAGDALGSGELYIHSPWNATAYYGVISEVKVKEGDDLAPGKTLFSLEVSDYSAQFQILNAQRQEYEKLMQELFRLYDSGVVAAPCDGLITGVDKNGAFLLSGQSQQWTIQLLADEDDPEGGDPNVPPEGGDPEPPPEETAVSYTVGAGQVIAVNDDGTYTLNTCSVGTGITSIRDVTVDTALMTTPQIMSIPDPVLLDDLTTPYPNAITVGDILYFVQGSDGSQFTVWDGNRSLPGQSGGIEMPDMGDLMGSTGGMGGMGYAPAPAFEPYTLETLTVASVTSQENMTLEITADEQDIRNLYLGQEATVTVEAQPGLTFPAVVTSIGNSGSNSGGSSKFTAKLTLNKRGEMVPGMNASAFLTLDTASNVLTVPVAALAEEAGRTLVYTAYNEKKDALEKPVAVTTGRSDGEYVEITGGLNPGDTVCYFYYNTPEISNIPENPWGF